MAGNFDGIKKQECIAAREQAVAAVSRETAEVEIVSAEETEALSGDSVKDPDEEEDMEFSMSY